MTLCQRLPRRRVTVMAAYNKSLVAGLLTACVGLLAASSAQATDLGLQPTTLQLDAQRDRTTVQVHNRGTEPVTLQADGHGWVRHEGQDMEQPTANLMVNPPLFTVPPGGTQLVRVGLRHGVDEERETLYRLVLRELPPPPSEGVATVSGQVRVLVALRLPVYAAPRVARREANWSLERDGDGQVYAARVTNTGNVHLRLAGLRLQGSDEVTLAEHGPAAPLFPGETRRLPLKLAGPLPQTPMRLEVRTPDEVRHVDVAMADR